MCHCLHTLWKLEHLNSVVHTQLIVSSSTLFFLIFHTTHIYFLLFFLFSALSLLLKMSKPDLLKIQTCVLKVNIDCDGCAQKVKKLLQKIDGVYSVKVDADEGKVVVAGDVDPEKLVKKLKRKGKHAEIWGGQKGMMPNQNYPINPQFQNMQVDNNNKVGKDIKSQNQKGQKGGGDQGQVFQIAHFPNMKKVQDLKVPVKEQKSVKFNLPEEEFDASDDGFDEYEDNSDDYDDDEEEEGLGHGHGHPMHHNKMMPKMGDGHGPHGLAGVMNGPAIHNGHKDNAGGSRNNNGSDKKGEVIDQAMLIKGKGGNFNEAKVDNNEKKKSSQKGKNKKGNKPKGNDVKKKDGGLLGRFLSFGKRSKKVESEEVNYANKSKNQNNESGNKKGKEGQKEGKFEDHSNSINDFDFHFHDYDKTPLLHKNGKVGQMGPSPKVENYPMGHQAVQGGGAMGHYQGMQMQHVPYNNLQQQQQYMGMMMNQPQQYHHHHHHQDETNMNNMYPTNMMYGRPHPSMNYMAPPPMPSHPMADPITHSFSDENVESCSIM